MGMESGNFGSFRSPGVKKTEDVSFKPKMPAFLKKAVVLTATAVASMLAYEKFYGDTDYTSVGTSTEAF